MDTIIIFLILFLMFLASLVIFRNKKTSLIEQEEVYTIDYLVEGIKELFNRILNENPYELIAKKAEAAKRERIREQLDENLRVCCHGDKVSKAYVKEHIKSKLQSVLNISELTIDKTIPFNDETALTIIDKFEIILHFYKNKYVAKAFEKLMTENNLDELKGVSTINEDKYYEVSKEDINNLYRKMNINLSYLDKLDILTQRIYSLYYGNGVIDEIRDMALDGISAGLSGLTDDDYDFVEELIAQGCPDNHIEYVYNSIWVLFHGKTIHMSCIGFESEDELERVAKKIYKFDACKYLSENDAVIVTNASDGARVVVARPKVAENWTFFIRKFDSVANKSLDKLITDKGAEKVISAIELIVKGNRTTCFSGDQAAGKTTTLIGACKFIDRRFTIRVDELMFELHLKRVLKGRNIFTMRAFGNITDQDIYELFKKSDGVITIIGEATSPEQASYVVQYRLSGSKCVFLTNHSNTTEDLVETVAFGLLKQYKTVEAAERMAAKTLNFDVHMEKSIDGHIYIDRITEIVLCEYPELSQDKDIYTREFMERSLCSKQYITNEIIVFENGEYVVKNAPTEKTRKLMFKYYSDREKQMYENLFETKDKNMEGVMK